MTESLCTMNKPLGLALLALAATLPATLPALAQHKAGDHAAHAAPSTAAASELVAGEVRKVDKSARKITIRHGEIKALEMPPMTMVYPVKDASLLDKLEVGAAIRFKAEKSANGDFVVTDIVRGK